MDFATHDNHRKHHKAPKKKKQGNAKAFAFRSGVRAAQAQTRALDIATKTHHKPRENYQGDTNPPIIISVFGGPRVGKSTLISSLIKRYNKQKISTIKGPVTIVTGKNQRITLIECNNDINSMIDLAKISDIVLLLIDATFDFELQNFELFNILHAHSLPKVITILTHLDLVVSNKSLTKYRKKIKQTIWQNVYEGAKLLCFTGFKNNLYGMREVFILSRYFTLSKSIPVSWRTSHPYLLSDRFEDLTDKELLRQDSGSFRKLAFYGYIHGTYMKHTDKVHIAGCGDFAIKHMKFMPDPCDASLVKKLALDETQRVIYAPFSGVGNVIYDDDAVYVDLEGAKVGQNSKGEEMAITEQNIKLSGLQDIKCTIDKKLTQQPIQIFQQGPAIYDDDVQSVSSQESQSDSIVSQSLPPENHLTTQEFFKSTAPHIALYHKIYESKLPIESMHESDDLFVPKETSHFKVDSSIFTGSSIDLKDPEILKIVSSKFIDRANTIESEDENFVDDSNQISPNPEENNGSSSSDEEIIKKSKAKSNKCVEEDEKYLNELKEAVQNKVQTTLKNFENMAIEERVLFQGYSPGMYVRMEIADVPSSFVENFDPTFPIVIGSIFSGEDTCGFLKLRVKKHKFYNSLLKNRDPMILSIGWRRFQTVMLYAHEDANKRLRSIKYTPRSDYCIAVCYGPTTQQGFGVLGLQKITNEPGVNFRISLVGVTLENDQSCKIVKKLKLVGYPFKIFKNTACIEKMFSSSLEVAKFEGGIVKTVSGIRGHIKKALSEKEGAFRATFEDKILMSDIVSLRTWVPIECPTYYNLVQNLLQKRQDRVEWTGMRGVSELRKEENIPVEIKKDSFYKPINRNPVIFAPLQIPQKLIKELPFSSRPKNIELPKPPENRPKIKNEVDREAASLINELSLIQKSLFTTRKLKRKKQAEEHNRKVKKIEEIQKNAKKISSKKFYTKFNKNRANPRAQKMQSDM